MNKKFDIIRSGIKLARHITFKARPVACQRIKNAKGTQTNAWI